MVNNYKLYKIVESIRANGFEFETFEVDESLYEILAYYGMGTVSLSEAEEILLKAELMPLAEEFEFSEVVHLALQEELVV